MCDVYADEGHGQCFLLVIQLIFMDVKRVSDI